MFYLDVSELPDATRHKLHRLSQIILSITRETFAPDPATDDIPIELHINKGYLPTDRRLKKVKRYEEGRGYVFAPPSHKASHSRVHHIVMTKDAVWHGGEYRFASQLSHELGHILFGINHSNALVETFCIAYSFFMMDQLAKYTKANWDSDFEPSRFLDYQNRQLYDWLKQFPVEIRNAAKRKLWYPLSLYLRYKRPKMDGFTFGLCLDEKYDNDYRPSILGAAILTSKPVPWAEMAGISARGSLREVGDTTDLRWQIDLEKLTPNVQATLRRLGRGSPMDFVVAKFDVQPWLFGGFRFYEDGKFVWLVEFPRHKRAKWEKKIAALRPVSVRWEDGHAVS